MSQLVSLLVIFTVLALAVVPAHANDPVEEAQEAHDLALALLDAGVALKSTDRIRKALGKLKDARAGFQKAAKSETLSSGLRERIKRTLEQIEVDIRFCEKWLDMDGDGLERPEVPEPDQPEEDAPMGDPESGPETPEEPEVRAPAPRKGQRMTDWSRDVLELYEKTESPSGRAALARQLATEGVIHALPCLFKLFETETNADAREGIHEALAMVGTSRVAKRMGGFATEREKARWNDALDVIYRCLEKKDKDEPERPFMQAIRRFHELKNRKLTLGIVDHLHAMGTEGVAALGEVLYVDDFGYHDYTIELLATKRDGRAVPPLVHKMNRFKFEYRVQMPAHKALLQMGWYAVPELINRLDNHAAGIWISWTLRKITGETMGTDKRKWGRWWTKEKVRHPELFDDPDERPGDVTPSSDPPPPAPAPGQQPRKNP